MIKYLLSLISVVILSLFCNAQSTEEQLQKAQLYFNKFTPATTDSAFSIYKQILGAAPTNKFAVAGLAEVYAEKVRTATDRAQIKKWTDSTFYFADKALQIDDKLQPALFAKASAFNRQGNPEAAAKIMQQLLQINPDYPRVARFYAGLARSTGNLQEHWKWSKKATEQEPGNPMSWWEHALSYAYLHEDSISAIYWKKMIEADPKRGTGWGELGYLQLLNGNTKGAVEYMRKAAELDPRPLLQLGLAYMLTADKHYAEAFAIAQQVLSKNPTAVMYGTTPGQILRAFLFKKLNQQDSARTVALQVMREIENGTIQSTIQKPSTLMAALYLILDDKKKAMEQLSIDAEKRFAHYRYIFTNPLFGSLHGYKSFEKLVKEWKQKSAQEKQKWKATALVGIHANYNLN